VIDPIGDISGWFGSCLRNGCNAEQ